MGTCSSDCNFNVEVLMSTTGETYAGNDGRKLSSPEEPVRGDHCGGLGRDPSAAPC